ncbi:14604_t:CDS:2 [Funneliformis geosporum]|nr:14604_t:CDS:2 [Funneliformis geosporum]
MSSNYNYDFNLSHLLNPENVPEMSTEDINSQLDFWINAEFQYDFQVSPTIDTKLEDQDSSVTQPMIIHDLSLNDQTQQSLYPLFTFPSTNFTSIFPTAPIVPVSIPTVVNNPIILPKDASSENTSSVITSEIIPDPKVTETVITKNVAVADVSTADTSTSTNTNSTTSTNVTALSGLTLNRKNSSMKSSNIEISQDESVKTKDDEEKVDHELSAKLAAEEDKRRRNTAASARFRVKKKMREQALERTAREMTAKAETLEGRVRELEMEIKCGGETGATGAE